MCVSFVCFDKVPVTLPMLCVLLFLVVRFVVGLFVVVFVSDKIIRWICLLLVMLVCVCLYSSVCCVYVSSCC